MIRSLRVIAAVVLLLTSIGTFIQPEIVENVLMNNQINHNHDDTDGLLGIQENERWLIIIIEFEGLPSGVGKDSTQAQNMLMGVDGADDYIDQFMENNNDSIYERHHMNGHQLYLQKAGEEATKTATGVSMPNSPISLAPNRGSVRIA